MTNKTTSAINLVERLRKVELHRRDLANADGDYWDRVLRNPDGPEAADTITRLKAALERVRGVIESGYRGVDKADKCPHDRFGFEDCIACYDEALLAAIDGSSLGGE